MTSKIVKTVAVASGADRRPLSKAQKAFNTLIRQIERQRAQLLAWEAAIPPYQKKYVGELVPLVEDSVDLQVEMVHCLDRASDQKGLTKTERRVISELIAGLAGELVASRDDAELKAVYNKHSRSDYDKQVAADMKGLKSVLEDALGVEFGDDLDLGSPEDIFKRAQAEMHEQQTQFEAAREEREARRARRKKSAKQLAAEARQQTDEQQISQSIREVYRKLASALHPDRESDPHERQRKTTLMQRVNQAYEKKNLLQLLELQLELEHIDQSALNNLSEDRLKHYNKILKDQLAELSQEILQAEARFRAQFDISPFVGLDPSTLMRHLARDISGVKKAVRDLKKDIGAVADLKTLKAWLKQMRRQARVDAFDFGDCPF